MYRLSPRDNTTPGEGRDPALFVQPKSGGSGDCHVANHPADDQDATEEALCQGQARNCRVMCSMVEHTGAKSSAALKRDDWSIVHALARRTSESRVRENRMHGLMMEDRREPVLYSTLFSSTLFSSSAAAGARRRACCALSWARRWNILAFWKISFHFTRIQLGDDEWDGGCLSSSLWRRKSSSSQVHGGASDVRSDLLGVPRKHLSHGATLR